MVSDSSADPLSNSDGGSSGLAFEHSSIQVIQRILYILPTMYLPVPNAIYLRIHEKMTIIMEFRLLPRRR